MSIFKPINGHSGHTISDEGVIKSLDRTVVTTSGVVRHIPGKIKPTHLDNRGYVRITLSGSARLVHRLVAIAFIPNPNNYPCVDHKDGNPTNCHVNNLRWVTQQENLLNRHKVNAKSGFVGVHKLHAKLRKPWVACGKLNGKAIHLGTFQTAAEASEARTLWENSVGASTSSNMKRNTHVA